MRMKLLDTQEVDECIYLGLKNVKIIITAAHMHLVCPCDVYLILTKLLL